MSVAGAAVAVAGEPDVVQGAAYGDVARGLVGGTGSLRFEVGVAAGADGLRKARFQPDDPGHAGRDGGEYADGIERRSARAAGNAVEPGWIGGGRREEHGGDAAG